MFEFASALVYGSFIGLTAVSIGTVLKPFLGTPGDKGRE